MNDSPRWTLRFQNFERACQTLTRALGRYQDAPDDEMVQMALIKAFEMTYELAWKTMMDYLQSEGLDTATSPKQTIRTAFQAGLIGNAEAWMEAVARRNMTSYVYDETMLGEVLCYIRDEFSPLAQRLREDLQPRL